MNQADGPHLLQTKHLSSEKHGCWHYPAEISNLLKEIEQHWEAKYHPVYLDIFQHSFLYELLQLVTCH